VGQRPTLRTEAARLCRGGSSSLTFKAVIHRQDSRFVSHRTHEGELHRRLREPKPHQVGVQTGFGLSELEPSIRRKVGEAVAREVVCSLPACRQDDPSRIDAPRSATARRLATAGGWTPCSQRMLFAIRDNRRIHTSNTSATTVRARFDGTREATRPNPRRPSPRREMLSRCSQSPASLRPALSVGSKNC
jgi:hypothetical protein